MTDKYFKVVPALGEVGTHLPARCLVNLTERPRGRDLWRLGRTTERPRPLETWPRGRDLRRLNLDSRRPQVFGR